MPRVEQAPVASPSAHAPAPMIEMPPAAPPEELPEAPVASVAPLPDFQTERDAMPWERHADAPAAPIENAIASSDADASSEPIASIEAFIDVTPHPRFGAPLGPEDLNESTAMEPTDSIPSIDEYAVLAIETPAPVVEPVIAEAPAAPEPMVEERVPDQMLTPEADWSSAWSLTPLNIPAVAAAPVELPVEPVVPPPSAEEVMASAPTPPFLLTVDETPASEPVAMSDASSDPTEIITIPEVAPADEAHTLADWSLSSVPTPESTQAIAPVPMVAPQLETVSLDEPPARFESIEGDETAMAPALEERPVEQPVAPTDGAARPASPWLWSWEPVTEIEAPAPTTAEAQWLANQPLAGEPVVDAPAEPEAMDTARRDAPALVEASAFAEPAVDEATQEYESSSFAEPAVDEATQEYDTAFPVELDASAISESEMVSSSESYAEWDELALEAHRDDPRWWQDEVPPSVHAESRPADPALQDGAGAGWDTPWMRALFATPALGMAAIQMPAPGESAAEEQKRRAVAEALARLAQRIQAGEIQIDAVVPEAGDAALLAGALAALLKLPPSRST